MEFNNSAHEEIHCFYMHCIVGQNFNKSLWILFQIVGRKAGLFYANKLFCYYVLMLSIVTYCKVLSDKFFQILLRIPLPSQMGHQSFSDQRSC